MSKEEIFSLIIMELTRRLSNEGESKVIITNDDMNNLLKNSSEVGFEESTAEQFVLEFIKFGAPVVQVAEPDVPAESSVEE